MLSILIPIYNYNACPLVLEIHKQALLIKKPFEIICIDDASALYQSENREIAFLSNCIFIELSQNIGRSKIRNLLASKANYDWLLFLDCDTFPKNSNFIANYISQILTPQESVFFGGILYAEQQPESNEIFRWEFGRKREAMPLEKRQKKTYQTTFVSNLLIHKLVFETILFEEKISKYGYEDAFFIQGLKNKNISIQHIENPLYHLNLETSEQFIAKTKNALETLLFLSNNYARTAFETKITKTYRTLSHLKVHFLVSILFQKIQSKLENNLTSKKPSLFLFDCYKIGYFCFLNTK